MENLDREHLAMSKPSSEIDVTMIATEIADHLRRELAYLNELIEYSNQLNTLLTRPRRPVSLPVSAGPPNDSADVTIVDQENHANQIANLGVEFGEKFAPIAKARNLLKSLLDKFKSSTDIEPTISQLTTLLAVPLREELIHLRQEIKSRLNELQAINMGNQTLLVYTLDFYERMITGMSSEHQVSQAYNSHGQVTSHVASHLFQKEY
ncbi:MAG TPA: flagellar export chaperone FlgN [Pirellulaceae bacterium]|nr:flagellar export chaperone FlgN [Pirellulaceae bacterium]HMO90913.1 flagellar export chaperone FlgN [Pirellulaceae bacterium]HMP68611.1 flagellar export chaperone FlgN [Pirellulaceae bacterium]